MALIGEVRGVKPAERVVAGDGSNHVQSVLEVYQVFLDLLTLIPRCLLDLVLLKVIFYFWSFLGAFLGLFFIFLGLLKQIQVESSFIEVSLGLYRQTH